MRSAFDERADDYDSWFERHPAVYQSELEALSRALTGGLGLEVGVGTGRFASFFGVKIGLDPSPAMLSLSKIREIEPVRGIAEALPFKDAVFDQVLFVTSLCFTKRPEKALMEANRVLRKNGRVVIGLIDRGSPLGQEYISKVKHSRFYEEAVFHSTEEVLEMMRKAGFISYTTFQTIFQEPERIITPSPITEGYGRGLFVVLSGKK